MPKLEGRLLLMPGLIELQKRELGYTGADDEISDEELEAFFEGKGSFKSNPPNSFGFVGFLQGHSPGRHTITQLEIYLHTTGVDCF